MTDRVTPENILQYTFEPITANSIAKLARNCESDTGMSLFVGSINQMQAARSEAAGLAKTSKVRLASQPQSGWKAEVTRTDACDPWHDGD